jgi:glycosyltransferase involved in cell wall biosynthesis
MPDSERKLNILIIPAFFPFPPTDGGKICTYSFIDNLRFKHNIHLFLRLNASGQAEILETMRDEWHNVTIHSVKDYTYPPEIGIKVKSLRGAKSLFKKIIRYPTHLPENHTFANKADSINRVVSPSYSLIFINALLKVLNKTRFDIIQTEYTPLLNLINVFPKEAKTVFLETESQHSLIKDYSNLKGANIEYVNYLSENAKTQELAYMAKYDAIFTLNGSDEKFLKEHFPDKKIYTTAFPVLDRDVVKELPENFAVSKIVLLGGEEHAPNRDGLFWFLTEILPLLELNKDIKILVTSRWFPETMKTVSAISDRVVFTGFVEDIKELLKNSVSIVPIRLGGGGIRTKTIYAMASNSAVVTTSLAAVGIEGKDENAFLIADTAPEFAAALNAVLNDEKLCETLVRNGKNVIEKHYRQKTLSERRNKFYHEIVNGE